MTDSSWTFDCALWSRRCWQRHRLRRVREQHPQIWLSGIRNDFRKPRPGEVNGVNYFFMTEQEFLAKEDAGEF